MHCACMQLIAGVVAPVPTPTPTPKPSPAAKIAITAGKIAFMSISNANV